MSIIFEIKENKFVLDTLHTRYAFKLVNGKFPVHLSYGEKIDADFNSTMISFAPYYCEIGDSYLPDSCLSEYNGFDSGDYRGYSLRVKNGDGNSVTMLRYKGHRIFSGRVDLPNLPFASACGNTDTLELQLVDETTGVEVCLYYTVFEELDIISRYISVENKSKRTVNIEKCMSLLLDLDGKDYDMISLCGGYYNERNVQRVPLHYGLQGIFSRRGASSHQMNPFMAVCKHNCTEDNGVAYGFNFVYSGSFSNEVEVDQRGNTRIMIGLGGENFSWLLQEGEKFISPEAVMTYTAKGLGGLARNFHKFIRKCILPPEPFEQRPVVLNTWEACLFDIDEAELHRFAEAAVESNIDMLVMDDGWFGERNSDNAGLGDWYANRNKFKDGLKPFVERIKSNGVKFGIWIEPEMVNPDSELYRKHPEWCLNCLKHERMQSRNQLVLDLGNPEVLNYLKDIFSATFDDIDIDYFKWDSNRHLSQVGSLYVSPDRQGEAAYRHMLGIYDLMGWFREKYPNAMIENCSGGGGRYDLGMMKYSTMIWASDNTNPKDRIRIQYGSMLGYPATTMSCHVSNHVACENPRNMQYRWHVAMGGALGYEMHLPNATETVRKTVKEQISTYRIYEKLILTGDYHIILNPFETNYSAYYYIDEAKEKILLSFLQQNPEEPKTLCLPIVEADENVLYYDEINGKSYTGEQLKKGINVSTENDENYSRMWCFIKQ